MVLVLLLMTISFFQTALADQTLSKNAEHVLDRVEYVSPAPSIIGKREWEELQLDRLVTILDRTKPSFGRWGLVQLLHPIADKQELLQRKKIITFLIEHEEDMRVFQEQLERVHRIEKSLLAYWDKHDQLNQSVEQFYYRAVGFRELNKSSLALNASTMMEMFNSWKYLIATLALGGLSAEFQKWIYSEQEKIDIWGGIRAGLEVPFRQHFPGLVELKPHQGSYTYKDYIKAFTYGSWGDRYNVLFRGYIADPSELGLPRVFQSVVPSFGKLGAFVGASIPTVFFDYQWGSAIYSVGQRIISMHRTLNQLQERVSDVAQCVQAIKKLRALVVKQAPELATYFADDMYDSDKADFIKKLLAQRFVQKPGPLYSRGHVLTMHLDIVQKKKTLIPLLHSVALLDAYCSIAQLYKESQSQDVGFSFPEFIESPKPFLQYHNAWLSLLSSDQAISNNLILGNNNQGKIIITGPNGGGKSTILKTFGVSAVLAQSWCIVPAKRAQQTLFSDIKTSLAPHEDLKRGLSTFMAEKKIMVELLDDIRHSDARDRMLVLIDEPYKGTVDAESAKRIYQFGQDVAAFPQALVAIATHVKKPITLEKDTGGIFGNYQVKIEEIKPGIFERLFKLEQGPAMWWFEDEEKRSRFVDWISVSGVSDET